MDELRVIRLEARVPPLAGSVRERLKNAFEEMRAESES